MNITKMIQKYNKDGYCPVGTKHLPKHIKYAIKVAGFTPMLKECFGNSMKLCLFQKKVPLRYCEGLVESANIKGFCFHHAWVMDEHEFHHDITLESLPEVKCFKSYEVSEIRSHLLKTKLFSPIDESWLNKMQYCLHFGIDINLSIEEIDKLIQDRMDEIRRSFTDE